MFDKLTNILDSFLETGIPGFDCILLQNGACVYRYYQGFSDTINRIPVNGTERYYIYSSSKPITCTAALQLYEKGIFQLDDPLSLYLPEFSEMSVKTPQGVKKAERKITIRDLFCMAAGFTYDLFSPMLSRCRVETNGCCLTLETVR